MATITALEVAGFKSALQRVSVNIRDLTILAGQNSAGKSAVIQPILMLKQSLEKPYDPGGLAIDGPIAKFTKADQFLSKFKGKRSKQFSVGVRLSDGALLSLYYGLGEAQGINVAKMRYEKGDYSIEWMEGQTISAGQVYINPNLGRLLKRNRHNIVVRRQRFYLVADVFVDLNSGKEEFSLLQSIDYARPLVTEVRRLIYLPGLRGNPERNYNITAAGPNFPGNFNDYVASVILDWKTRKDERINFLGEYMRRLGLTWKVDARRINDTQVEILVGRQQSSVRGGARDVVSIADVGFGVSQTLPLLVALLVAQKDQIIYVEQPEIHLHPRAQVALAELFVEALKRGVRLVIETHSSLLLLAFQTFIANGTLEPSQVSMNWFTRDATGQTEVTEAEIDDDGSYGAWPVDFGTIELDLQSKYLDSVDRRRAEQK